MEEYLSLGARSCLAQLLMKVVSKHTDINLMEPTRRLNAKPKSRSSAETRLFCDLQHEVPDLLCVARLGIHMICSANDEQAV